MAIESVPTNLCRMTGLDTALGKLHRASCIVAHVAESQLGDDKDDPITGETLKAAEDLILAAMVELEKLPVAAS